MNKIKSMALISLAILLATSFSAATAQKRAAVRQIAAPLPVVINLSGPYNVKVSATELSRGEFDYASGTTYGWTWYGKTEGDLSGFMFVSVNYGVPAVNEEVDVHPVGVSSITGGSWSKLIFIKGQYAGSVSGRVTGGDLTWNEKAQNWTVNLELASDQGSDAFVGCTGKGTFAGVLDPNGKLGTISGVLTLEY